ncbi:MAG: hypothetical protein KGI50_01320 [Patescibacteria group bacterium]|nr:hypothetical protein [Patescibacteria group bacterium]MDE2438010.1 hypothetical protein [Patescibacteria group bacterium]
MAREIGFRLKENDDREKILEEVKAIEGIMSVSQLRPCSKSARIRTITMWCAVLREEAPIREIMETMREIPGVLGVTSFADCELM